jgi:hypothetical protein
MTAADVMSILVDRNAAIAGILIGSNISSEWPYFGRFDTL